MNATETRNHLRNVCGSLLDHLDEIVKDWTEARNANGPEDWRGVGDLERLTHELCEIVARFDGNMTAEEFRTEAEEIARMCGQ